MQSREFVGAATEKVNEQFTQVEQRLIGHTATWNVGIYTGNRYPGGPNAIFVFNTTTPQDKDLKVIPYHLKLEECDTVDFWHGELRYGQGLQNPTFEGKPIQPIE